MTNKSNCIFTIASKNYISPVRTLLASVAKHHPEAAIYLVLCDKVDGYFDPSKEPFETILAEDLGIDHFSEMAFKYGCVELNTAIKPYAIEKFFRQNGFERVLYFDPDILLYRHLHDLFRLLEDHDVILTPHLTEFLPDDGCLPDNRRILQTGTNNLGFVGMRRSARVLTMLDWWKKQLFDQCRHALSEGLFVDQKWMDLIPSCVESTTLLRDQGCNVAYWNLASRHITRGDNDEYLVNGDALTFFHFSGFSPDDSSTISKHDTRLSWSDIGKDGQAIFKNYRKLVIANGYNQTKKWPYAYGCLDNGTAIPDCIRSYFHKHWAGGNVQTLDVFSTSKDRDTVYGRLQSPIHKGPLTEAAMALYEHHPDLQTSFPNIPGSDVFNYAHWLVDPSGGFARMDEVFIEPIRLLLKESSPDVEQPAHNPLSYSLRRMGTRVAKSIIRFAGKRRRLVNFVSPRIRHQAASVLRRIAYQKPVSRQASGEKHQDMDSSSLQSAVNIFGLLERPTGVGEAACGMAACFEHLQIPTKKIALEEKHLFFGQPLPSTAKPDPRFAINFCHVNADCTEALRNLFNQDLFAKRLNIGFWAWELESFPEVWDREFDSYDEIWVPSTFVQQAVAARARIPVVCIPHCITPPSFSSFDRASFGIPSDRPVVLCMFDAGSYSERKNPLGAIEAFKRACAQVGHDPLLVIKVGRPELENGLFVELQKAVQHIDCHIIEGWLNREQTWGLINACDAFVSLHRSEGFGLVMAEAMALGKPVIGTGYSGNMDFMNPTNSFLVNYQLTTLKNNVGPYPVGARWAEPDLDHAADQIRTVLENSEWANSVGIQAAADVARNLSVEAVGQRILNRLNRLGFSFPEPSQFELHKMEKESENATYPMSRSTEETLPKRVA